MNIDIEKVKEYVKWNMQSAPRHAKEFEQRGNVLKALEQQQAEIEKLKAESQANLDGWKQARRIIEKMNKRLRK